MKLEGRIIPASKFNAIAPPSADTIRCVFRPIAGIMSSRMGLLVRLFRPDRRMKEKEAAHFPSRALLPEDR